MGKVEKHKILPVFKALVCGLLAWLLFAAIGVGVALFFPLWPWSAILGILMFLGAPLPALLVALIILLKGVEEC